MIGEAFQFARLFPFSGSSVFQRKISRQDGLRATISNSVDHSIPLLGPRVSRAARIHSEASMRATMRSGGISTFFDQLGFMLR